MFAPVARHGAGSGDEPLPGRGRLMVAGTTGGNTLCFPCFGFFVEKGGDRYGLGRK